MNPTKSDRNACITSKASSVTRIIRIAFMLILFISAANSVSGQTYTWTGSTGDGVWTNANNWSPARTTPGSGDILTFNIGGSLTVTDIFTEQIGKLIITNNTTLTLKPGTTFSSTLTLSSPATDALSVASGSTLNIIGTDAAVDQTLTITTTNTVGLEMNISGTLSVGLDNLQETAAGGFLKGGSNVVIRFNSGSVYVRAKDGGSMPDAVWDVNSTCNVTGVKGLVPIFYNSVSQPFGNFIWNCALQNADIDLSGTLTTVSGNMTVLSTNASFLQLGRSISSDLTIGGNFTMSGGKFSIGAVSSSYSRKMSVGGDFSHTGGIFYVCSSNGSGTLDVNGNLTSSSTFNFTYPTYPATAIVNANGNFTLNAGTFDMSATSSTGTLNVKGDFSLAGGTLTESSTGSGDIFFKGSGVQTFTTGGTLSGNINFTVNSGSFLQMGSGATPSILTGSVGAFTLASGATLGVTSPQGIVITGSTGNIQVSGSRTFTAGANYVYNGSSAQVTGTGFLQNIPGNCTVNNSSGVTLGAATAISGLLTLSSGTLNLANFNLTTGSLTGSSDITSLTGTPSAVLITVGSDNTSPASYSGVISAGTATSVALTKTGSGTLILSGTNSYTGNTTLSSGVLQLGSSGCIDFNSPLILSGGTLDMGNNNLTIGRLSGSSNITNIQGSGSSAILTIGSSTPGTITYSGIISNGTASSVSLTKTGAETLVLTGANSFSGPTTVTGGILQLGISGCIGDASNLVLNGGTLSTGSSSGLSETMGMLDIQAASVIALGTGSHSLNFASSETAVWGGGAALTVNGWTGTAGLGGTSGRIFVGSSATALTPAQLAAITFTGYAPGAGILVTGEVVPVTAPAIVISSPNPSVAAGSILQNTINNVIYRLDISVSNVDATLQGLQITTSGTYSASDITNFKAWYSTDNTFDSGTDVVLSTKSTSLGAGTQVFPSWTNKVITSGTTGYIFITTDVPCNSTAGSTIYVPAIAITDLTFWAGNKSGTAYDGGVQSIDYANPATVTSVAATPDDKQSTVTWINPDCFDQVMIVAKAGSAASATPSGDGSTYTESPAFGSGTAFDGGFVVYKGSVSSQKVTGLTNGTTYFYTIYSRRASKWSTGVPASALAQLHKYRSSKTGLWSDLTAWDMSYDGGSTWAAATAAPASTDGTINIRNGHVVTVSTGVTVDETTVDNGGKITVNNVTLIIANGAGDDLSVNGTLEVTGASGALTTTGNLKFLAGGTYIHNRDGGVIPTAQWDPASNCNITGLTTLLPTTSTFAQIFGNFTWNTPGFSVQGFSLTGNLQSIAGNMSVVNTGTGYLVLGGSGVGNLTVGGNYSQTGGTMILTFGTAARIMNVTGNFLISSGVFWLSKDAGAGLGTLSLSGNFTHSGGTIQETSGNHGTIVFNGSGSQLYTSGGVFSGVVNIAVNSTSTLQMGTGASPATIPASTTGLFTLAAGAGLGITSSAGITSSGATGNIQLTGIRTFSSSANYIYNGAGAQSTGNGLPSTVASLSVSGTSNLSLTSSPLTVSGTLSIDGTSNLNIGATQQVSSLNFNNSGTMIISSTALNSNGSFIATGSLTQTGTVTYNRQLRIESNFGDLHLMASPVQNNLALNSSKITNVYSWDELTGTWPTTGMSSLESGKGYNLDQTSSSDGLISFTGKIVNSASVTATSPYATSGARGTLDSYQNPSGGFASGRSWGNYGGGGWNLLGNPFTSAMNAGAFVTANVSNFDPNYQAIYIYDGTTGTYSWAAASVPGFPASGSFGDKVQAGQGFFALAYYDGITFNFTSDMMLHNNTVPMLKSAKIEKPWPGLQLKAKYGDKETSTLVVFNEKMSVNLDPGYDVGLYSSGTGMEIYTLLASDDNIVSFARQALPLEGCEKYVIPVGINSAKGGELTFSGFVVPVERHKFFLEDRLTGIVTNLNTDKYTATIPEKTYGTGRFFLYTTSNAPRTIARNPNDRDLLKLKIWSSEGMLIIEGAVSGNARAEIFTLRGIKVFQTRLAEGGYNSIPLPSLAKGVYIVKVTDEGKVSTYRIVIM